MQHIRCLLFFLLLTLMTCLFSCTGNKNHSRQSLSADTLHTEEKAMEFFCCNPDKAFLLIDSAEMAGNLTHIRSEYLRAITLYNGKNDFGAARSTALRALAESEKEEEKTTRLDLLELLTTIAYSTTNYADLLRYSTATSQLAHEVGDKTKVDLAAAYNAFAKIQLGKKEEGLKQLKESMQMLASRHTYRDLASYVAAGKKLLFYLNETKDYAAMTSLCEDILSRLDFFNSHPEKFSNIPKTANVSEFYSFCRNQLKAFLAVADANTGKRAEALRLEQEIEQSEWKGNQGFSTLFLMVYEALGQWDKMDAVFDSFAQNLTDSISDDHVFELEMRATAAQQCGKTEEANRLLSHALTLRDSLDARRYRDHTEELTILYDLQEERFARQKTEALLRQTTTLIIALGVITLALLIFALYVYQQRRKVRKKNLILVRYIDEHLQQEELTPAKNPETEQEKIGEESTFTQDLRTLILTEHLYTDPAFNREKLCERMGISRRTLTQRLSANGETLAFPMFINAIRLSVACEMLRTKPHTPISTVAESVGLSPRNFQKLFRQQYGMTPSEYKQGH